MGLSIRRVAIAAAMVGAYAGHIEPAAAQTATTQGVPTPRKGTTVERKIDVSAGVDANYSSNILGGSNALAAASTLTPEDFVFSPTVDVDVKIPFGPNNFSISGSLGYDFYARNSRRDSDRISLASSLGIDVGRCSSSLDTSINRFRSSFGNFDPTTSALALTSNQQTNFDLGGTVSCGGDVGLRPFASATYSLGRNSLPLRQISDYQTVSYGGGVSYVQPSIGEIGLVGSIQDSSFPQRIPGAVRFGQTGLRTYNIGLFYSRAVTRTFQARVQLNYTEVVPDIAAPAFRGLSGEASVKIIPSGLLEIELKATRGTGASLSFNVDYVLETTGSVALRLPITPKLELNGHFDTRSREFFGASLLIANPLLDDNISTLRAGARFKVLPRVALGLTAAYVWRRANDPIYNYNAAQAALSARFEL